MSKFEVIQNPTNLKGKVAVVTGGSSGIGRGAVELFCSLGVNVVSADIQLSTDPLPKGAIYQQCNVKNWDDIKRVFEEARKQFGSVDIVCANAGNNDKENLLKNDDKEPNWEILDVNLKGAMMTLKAAMYHFRQNKPAGGVVIITGSITSFVPAHEGMYVYSASKYALLGLLRTMRMSFPKYGSRINLVAPYLTATGLRGATRSKKDNYPDQQVNEAVDIARAIATLAADENANGKAVVCIGDHYFETEEMREKLLPQVVSSEVTEGWARVLKSNPFAHMTEE